MRERLLVNLELLGNILDGIEELEYKLELEEVENLVYEPFSVNKLFFFRTFGVY